MDLIILASALLNLEKRWDGLLGFEANGEKIKKFN